MYHFLLKHALNISVCSHLGRPRARIQYTYPPSPSSSDEHDSPARHWSSAQKLSFAQRVQLLKSEVAALEQELASQEKDKQPQEGHFGPAELIRELADVKVRLNKVGLTGKKDAGRSKLVSTVLLEGTGQTETKPEHKEVAEEQKADIKENDMVAFTTDIDRRLGALEKAIGSSTTTLDEVCLTECISSSVLTSYRHPHYYRH